jgi:excisionase family DNA binding protein
MGGTTRRRPIPTDGPADQPVDRDPPETIVTARSAVPMPDRLALSVEEAGALLGMSRDLVYDLVNRRELPSVRLGRRLVVPRKALEALLDERAGP